MTDIGIGHFLFIIFLVLLNGFFVASEFAFVRVRSSQINALIDQGSRRARRVKQIIDDLDRSLSSTQLGITLASIALGFMGEVFFEELLLRLFHFLENTFGFEIALSDGTLTFVAFLIGYLIITFLHVVIGELAPKSISIQFAEQTALVCAEPLHWFMVVTNPLLNFFVWTSNQLLKAINVPPVTESHGQVHSEEELKMIIQDSINRGELEKYESKLIFNILTFTDQNVKAILTPRIDIKALPITSTPQEILALTEETGFSRIPIYEETVDNVRGFVHIKDIIGYVNGDNDIESFKITEILREVIITPEGKPLDDLLQEMQKLKTQIAVIVDEYGSVEGIVTIEDILEYLVGPIDDEFDASSSMIKETKNGSLVVGGLVAIEAFNSTINEMYSVEIKSDESTTIAGYVLELFGGEIPKVGMIKEDEKFKYEISETSINRIEKVKITKLKSE